MAVPRFPGVAKRHGEKILNGEPRAALRPIALCARRSSGLWAAQERARALARARRLYRGRSDRARPVLVLPLDRAQPEAALRPDRSLPLSHRAARRAVLSDTVGAGLPNVDLRIAESGEVLFKSPGMFVGYFKDEQDRRGDDRRRLHQDRRRRLLRPRPASSRSSTAPRTSAASTTARCSRRNTSRTS